MPNDTEIKPVEETVIDTKGAQRTEDRLDTLFGVPKEEPVVDPPKDKKEKSTKKPAVEDEDDSSEDEEEESEDEDKDESEDNSDEEEDWDAPINTDKDDEDEEVDLSDKNAAAKQAKLRGKEAKRLRAELTEKELEAQRLKEENETLQARIKETEAIRIKPSEHPEYKTLRDKVISDVRSASELLNVEAPDAVVQNFGPLMADFLHMDSLSGGERTAARDLLKGKIADTLKLGGDVPYQDLDDDERRVHTGTINEVIKIIQRNAGDTRELQKLHDKLEQSAQSGRLALGVREYTERRGEFDPILASVGDLAEDVIEADPHTMSAVVAKLAKANPEVRKRLDKAKEEVIEAFLGPRALTQAELDTLANNGTDLKEFQRTREASHREKQRKLAAMFVQALVLRAPFKEMSKKLAELQNEQDADESELDTIRAVTKKKPKAPAPKDTKDRGPAASRPSAANKLFDSDD